jgi:hypothetical protein
MACGSTWPGITTCPRSRRSTPYALRRGSRRRRMIGRPLARDLVVIVQDRKEQAPSPLARLIAQWEEALHAEAVRAKRGDSGPDE